MDELALAERLVAFDSSAPDGVRAAQAFVAGWLRERGVQVRERTHNGLPVLSADVGAADGPTLFFHGHVDVVPAPAAQFVPRVEGDRLIGRGALDMKGGLAAMMCALCDVADQDRVRVRFMCVPDEEAEEIDSRSTDVLVDEQVRADFAITGEPTDLHVGVQAKGVLVIRVHVRGKAAHGSTPWLGDNAVTKAIDVFRRIETMPFSRESSELFDRPSINLGRIKGGDVINKVPDLCTMDIDIRYLPGQDPEEILAQIRQIGHIEVERIFHRIPALVSRHNPYVLALCDAVGRFTRGQSTSVGRDGASDAVSFLAAGIPAVECGPTGEGHHGPDEWVSVESLARYRAALASFVRHLPEWLERQGPAGDGELPTPEGGDAVEGGLA